MYQIPMINTVRSWEKRIESAKVNEQQTQLWAQQPNPRNISTGLKPVIESEHSMFNTSLINAVQLWERRWQAEENQRNQRIRVADTAQQTILRRLPRLKLGHKVELKETADFNSCC